MFTVISQSALYFIECEYTLNRVIYTDGEDADFIYFIKSG